MRRARGTRSAVLAGLAGIGAGIAALAFAQAAPPAADQQVDAIFQAMTASGSPGCALAVMRDGREVYRRGYGTANLEYGVPITPASVFHVASLSKEFTAAAVALLVADGRVSWTDDVRKYVPEVPDFGRTITLDHLAHHTSGLRDQWDLLSMAGWRWEADVVTTSDVLDITSRQRALNFDPGAEYLYSNTGFTLLGVVVQRVSGKSLRTFTRERIFEPLGMHATFFRDGHQIVVPNRAYAYAPGPKGEWLESIPDFDTVGATSLFTTVNDLARWDLNFYTHQVGGEALAALQDRRGTLADGRPIAYGLGLVHGEYRGLRTVSHGGADAGYRAQFLRVPEERLSVAVLCNFPSSAPASLAERVADVNLAGRLHAPAEPPTGTPAGLTAGQLRSLAGVYTDPATDVPVRLRFAGGRLVLVRGRDVPLAGDGPGRFRSADGAVRIDVVSMDRFPVRLRLSEATGHVASLTGAPPPDAAAALDAYVGAYHSDELDTDYVVERSRDGLVIRHRKLGVELLRPLLADGFRFRGRSITFHRADDGRVAGFTISTGRVRKVRFTRVVPHS